MTEYMTDTISGELLEKYNRLKDDLREMGSAAVAFSSGVDSTFLLYAAHEALGEKVLAVTASSCSFPGRELTEAKEFCKKHGIRQIVFESEELDIPGFRENPANRCYLCKKGLFEGMIALAKEHGMAGIVEGSNLDDNGDYRPGLLAIRELGIGSPLRKVGFTKQEIRDLSAYLGLPTWNKPSFACLASRFPYGEEITRQKLGMVERAEQYLLELGFKQFRVRIHGNVARIELLPSDISRMLDEQLRTDVNRKLKEIGFAYVSLDLIGYRTGSMNETLNESERAY